MNCISDSNNNDKIVKKAELKKEQYAKDAIKYTSCSYHCLNNCILKVIVRDGVIVGCEPDDTINSGIPREDGYISDEIINRSMIQNRPCAKGYAQTRMLYDPRRLKYPMKRVGNRGEAKFERISWEEALDTIAEKLEETRNKYGPFSILHQPYVGFQRCSFPLAPWFGAGFAGWDAHSVNGFQEPEHWVLGKDVFKGELVQDQANILKSKLIVLWGSNPLTTLSGGFAYNLLRARERGIPIICVESRYTSSAEVLADQWIPIRPTTDVAMMIAMANVWFKEDLCDKEFINKYVEQEGLQKWQAYVLGATDGIDKTPLWAERICGVPAETIEKFARLYAGSKPVNLIASASLGRQFYGENPARAIMYLQALTGNTCIAGGTSGAETSLHHGHPAMPTPMVDWQQEPGTYNPPVLMCAFKWLKSIDIREKLDKGEMTREEYNRVIGNTPENESPNIKMVILESNNHMNNVPDINSNIRSLKKVDFVTVFSYFAETLSARYADILLPQIATAFEGRACKCGVMSSDLFSVSMTPGNCFVYRQKCIDPPGEIKTNEWIWVQIARRLGIAELYQPRLAHVTDDEWDGVIEDLHREAYENWSSKDDIVPLSPPGWDEFQKKPVFRWEIKHPYYPFKEEIERGDGPLIETESGKIELYSKGLAKGPLYLAKNEFFPGTGKCYGDGKLSPMAQMTMGGRDTFYSQDTKKYPLLMSSPHSFYRVHSLLDNQPLLNEDCYRHAVWLNIADAKARGIKDNDLVKVYNDVGEMIIPAYVTSRVVPGTVCVFHGSWYMPDESKNGLMSDSIDRRGAPNLLTHNEDLPDTIIGFYPCKGLVQIEQWKDM
jgi:anaerobic dimethyl sulfoxide reductase subunit A